MFWLAAVVCFMSIAVYEVYSTLNEYLGYPTVIKIHEGTVRNREDMPPPQVTVCNSNPLPSNSEEIAQLKNIVSFTEFKIQYKEFLKCRECSLEERLFVRSYTRGMTLINAYYQHIGEKNATELGHKQEWLISDCKALDMNGFANFNKKECTKNLVTASRVSSPDYFNCYEYYIDYIKQLVELQLYLGFGLVLHLDQPAIAPIEHGNLFETNIPTGAKVIRIFLHSPKSLISVFPSSLFCNTIYCIM